MLKWLAETQGTAIPVVPVHTLSEQKFFKTLMAEHRRSEKKAEPNWIEFTKDWIKRMTGDDIYYKLPEHLKAHYKFYFEARNEDITLMQGGSSVFTFAKKIRAPQREVIVDPAKPLLSTERPSKLRKITSSLNDNPIVLEIAPTVDLPILRPCIPFSLPSTLPPLFNPAGQFNPFIPHPLPPANLLPRVPTISIQPTFKNRANHADSSDPLPPRIQRSDRKCQNCFSTDCKGKWSRKSCTFLK